MINYSNEQLQEELQQIVFDLLPLKPKKVILFGSMARGDYHEFSDVDLLIIRDTDKRFIERIEEVCSQIKSRLPVEPLVYTESEFERMLQEENSLIKKALEEGVVLFEQ